MGLPIARTPLAQRDLVDVWEFIAADNEAAADRLLDRVASTLEMLGDNPHAGRARPELAPNLRSFAVGNYVLFYRPLPDMLVLVRVLSGYQDVEQVRFPST